MKKDIVDLFDECETCTQHNMQRNKELPPLPEEETTRPFECITMDGFQTNTGEHGIAIWTNTQDTRGAEGQEKGKQVQQSKCMTSSSTL